MASSFSVAAVIRGYHVYKEIWNAKLDEELMCETEVGNRWDTFAVAMRKGSVTVGHVPRAISPICSIFILRGRSIKCRATGNRQYFSDLPQGGLELPCVLTFTIRDQAECRKTEKCTNDSIRSMEDAKLLIELEEDNDDTSNAISTSKASNESSSNILVSHSDSTSNTGTSGSTSNTGTSGSNNSDNASTSSTIFSTSVSGTVYSCTKSKGDIIEVVDLENAENESPTKKVPRYIDTHLIIMGEKLTDIEVNHCQKMLKQQFPNLNGLRSTLQQDKPSKFADN